MATNKVTEESVPATVVSKIDGYTVAINRGARDGVQMGQRFCIYAVSDEPINDPNTGESLGQLEIVKGTGKVINVQERMSSIESDRYGSGQTKRVIKHADKSPLLKSWIMVDPSFREHLEEEIIEMPSNRLPFENARVGDRAKRI